MASITCSPSFVPVSASTTTGINLSGSGTSWSSGSTSQFTLSGNQSPSLAAQCVSTATEAVVFLPASLSPGVYTISDGTNNGTIIVVPASTVSSFSDNFKRSNSGTVGNGWIDNDGYFEINSDTLQNAVSVSNSSWGYRLYNSTTPSITNGTLRVHFGPGINTAGVDWAVFLWARVQNTASETSDGIFAFYFPTGVFTTYLSVGYAKSTSTGTVTATSASSGESTTEGWLEFIFNGSTLIANVYSANGTTLLGTVTSNTTLTGDNLSAGAVGIGMFWTAGGSSSNQFIASEFDAFNDASISLNPANTIFGVGDPTTVAASGTNTAFSTSGSLALTPSTLLSNLQETISSGTAATLLFYAGTQYGEILVSDTGGTSPTGAYASFNAQHSASSSLVSYTGKTGTLKIGGIGDSIMYGINGYPLTVMQDNLESFGYTVDITNLAVTGTTSQYWATSAAGGQNYIVAAVASMVSAGCTYCVVMLGTNDARTPYQYTAAQHETYMASVIGAITAAGIKVILFSPIWSVVPNLFNAGAGDLWPGGSPYDSNLMYQNYHASDVTTLVNGSAVYDGGYTGLYWFQNNPSHLQDGIHPTVGGCTELGNIWTNAFMANGILNSGVLVNIGEGISNPNTNRICNGISQ